MATDSETEGLEGRPEAPRKAGTRTRVPDHEISDLRNVEFPVGMRGYDRAAVDDYITRVNRILAELQITAAPESAIRHALDEVADDTRGILERAHETADEITRRSRSQADDRLQKAEREAKDVRGAADAYANETRAAAASQVGALQADVDRIWKERDSLLSGLRELAAELEQIAVQASERYQARPELHPQPKPAPPPEDPEGG
jgi:DivIVA domain-containing protein